MSQLKGTEVIQRSDTALTVQSLDWTEHDQLFFEWQMVLAQRIARIFGISLQELGTICVESDLVSSFIVEEELITSSN